MNEEQLYDEALKQMGQAPPEPNENPGPRRRGRKPGDGTGNRGGGRQPLPPEERAIDVTVTLHPDLVHWLDSLGPNRSRTITNLLREIQQAARTRP